MNRLVALSLLALALVATDAVAQTVRRGEPSVALRALTGRDSFDGYCASCHGTTGKGDGPLAASLKRAPADLTTLARRNGGTYPRSQVSAAIEGTGRMVASHGATEMPLWGGIFRWLDSDARSKLRIDNLVAYIESLQVPADSRAQAAPRQLSGAELFQTFCAGCHGPNAKGDGVMAGQLRRDPPDLTKLLARDAGAVPAERLRRIIDGREVTAHGDRTMPIWGDVFMRREGDRDAASARVAALVAYIMSIPERPAE
jgi:mono/diheme cytochrome c family protein